VPSQEHLVVSLAPILGAVGAVEYMFIKELNLYRHLIPGLIVASVGYGVYFAILHTSFLGIYDFPNFASLRVVDLGWALLVGVIAGAMGILFKLVFGLTQSLWPT
jgi:chloride channel protein, CIC family